MEKIKYNPANIEKIEITIVSPSGEKGVIFVDKTKIVGLMTSNILFKDFIKDIILNI